ncbi:MAG: hypothetical protein HC822_18035 [Oscillochloris sp.]|nr:hypothetical protein [Oscillochloris sp.]
MTLRSPVVRRDIAVIVIALLLAYAYVLPRWADWSQNSRLNLTRALVEQNTVRIDSYVHNTGDYALYRGHAYTDKAPGPSLAAVPFYALAQPLIDQPTISKQLERLAGGGALSNTLNPEGSGLNRDKIQTFVAQVLLTLIIIALPSALSALVLERLLASWGVTRGARLSLVLAYGLATPFAIYAGNFYSHSLVAALCITAAALLFWLAEGRGTWMRALLIGLLMGYAVISEYPAALICGALGIYAIVRLRPRYVAWIIGGGLVPVVLMLVYDMVAFGTPLPIGYSHSALWQDQHHTGFMSISYPSLEALWGLTFGGFRGLFVRAPWLLLAGAGAWIWWRSGKRRAELIAIGAGTVLTTIFYASSIMWWGGFGVGPRYLVPIIPLLALMAAPAISTLWKHRLGASLLIALIILSTALTWIEGTAGQSFPPDTIRATWAGYVLPQWAEGSVARNLGSALGLSGALSLLPLLLAVAGLLALLAVPMRPQSGEQPATQAASALS